MKPPIVNDTDLGTLVEIARYMRLGRTKLSAIKKCAARRMAENPGNPTPFCGGVTCKQWVMQWLQRNPDFGGERVEFPRLPTRTR